MGQRVEKVAGQTARQVVRQVAGETARRTEVMTLRSFL